MFLCLPHSGVTAQVLEEIEPQLAPGALVIDTTTGEPGEMEAFGARLASRQVDYADATVAGSSGQVRKGEAIVMAGAEAHVYASCLPLLQAVAPRCFHVGPCGAGARIKLVVNLVLGLNRAVLAEGLAYAEACGVDPALALEVLKASPAYSRAMDVKGARMLTGDYEPEARLRQHHKDVRLILEQAREHGARVPFSRLHDLLLAEAEDRGLGDRDNAAIREVFRAAGRAV
jgi:2-hydroxy-3-oxopropionate reductase